MTTVALQTQVCYRAKPAPNVWQHRRHLLSHVDEPAAVVGGSWKKGEMFLYLVRVADGCEFWAAPWEVKVL